MRVASRLWVMSDLHLERIPYPSMLRFDPPPFDVLVLAGDTAEADPEGSVAWAARFAAGRPSIVVLGNHEAWGMPVREAADRLRRACVGTSVVPLLRDAVVLAGVRFLGCTLWGDGEGVDPDEPTGEGVLNEAGEKVRPRDLAGEHAADLDFLRSGLQAAGTDLPTVVVTHHAPLRGCMPKERSTPFSVANSCSDLADLTDAGVVDLWVHGHVHSSVDMVRPGGTRILCNPAGGFVNPAFQDGLVVEV